MSAPSFLYSQLFVGLPQPDHDFTGQTIAITGANTGLGLEAARHLLKLNASQIILGVRNTAKGEAAKKDLEQFAGQTSRVDVFELDMENYQSVQSFAIQLSTLPRIDVVILNAGKIAQEFYIAEEDESTITVNVVSTILLALLLLPKLRGSAQTGKPSPRLVIVSSDRHVMTNLPEWKASDTFEALRSKGYSGPDDRYLNS
jgi:NAD(P)-dependent dehydrogenase (short-subunit alcohol dehydrogenase family)